VSVLEPGGAGCEQLAWPARRRGEKLEVQNKVVIVTGASSGIGKATAMLFASKGARVVLAARSVGVMKKIAAKMPDSLVVGVDLRKRSDVRRMVREAHRRYGRIDVLVNDAGQGMAAPVEHSHIDDVHRLVTLNLYAPLLAMQAVIPLMSAQGAGAIVNIASKIIMDSYPPFAAYTATKAGLAAISKIARLELADRGIVVSTVYPDLTATNFNKNLIPCRVPFDMPELDMSEADPPEKVAARVLSAVEGGAAEEIL
jgi:NADP-dependent 3-hydroxy acid dehydrogenase YdfG